VSDGDVVVVVGRRRRGTYGRVSIGGKKGSCTLSANLAANLRLRQDDKLKIVPLEAKQEEEERSGDLLLVTGSKPADITSATFSPIDDSLAALESGEGGDEISDEEIMDRFIRPYTEDPSGAMLKKGHILTLRDENGKSLAVMVSHVDLDGAPEKEETAGKLT
jgi:hypothetical protein